MTHRIYTQWLIKFLNDRCYKEARELLESFGKYEVCKRRLRTEKQQENVNSTNVKVLV